MRIPLVALCLCLASTLSAAERKEAVDTLVKPALDAGVAGIVIGVVDNGKTEVFSYGSASSNPTPGRNTLFEIGSVTKTFTGLALAVMAQKGDLKLDDPVRKYLPPEALDPPAPAGEREVTLLDLATQTSGFPRLPYNLPLADIANPYAKYDIAHLYAAVKQRGLVRPAEAKYNYSNFGFGLLGHVLARKHGGSYETLIRDLITAPLGMRDTRIELDAAARGRLAQGHTAKGEPAGPWDLNEMSGAGAIRSTVDDMLRYAQAQLDLPAPLAAAIQTAHQLHPAPGAPGDQLGLAWHTMPGTDVLWHNGATGGYHSWISFSPGRKTAVVVLSNTQSAQIDRLGSQLQRSLLSESR